MTRAQLKQNAKDAMRGKKPSVYLVVLAYSAIIWVLELLVQKVTYPWLSVSTLMSLIDDPESLYYYAGYMQPSFLGTIVAIALNIMVAMIGIGLTIYALRVSRRHAAGFGDLFDAFGMFFKFLWLTILMGIFVFLWSLLLWIPGIIAAYRYRMAYYIMIDNPEFSAMECIRRSKEMMRGHKGELFVLDLSFILWNILTIIPFVSLYVTPYIEVTNANFYNNLSGYVPADAGDVGGNGGQYAEYERPEGTWDNTREPWDK